MEWIGTVAILLVCPLMMLFMMRGGHGHGHGHAGHVHGDDPLAGMSDEQLRELARRAQQELDERAGDVRA